MNHRVKLIVPLAAVLISAASSFAPATATPGSKFTPTGIIIGHFGTLHVNTPGEKTGKWGMMLKTLDATDVDADRLTVQAGGFSGWHSHPGPVFVTMVSGNIVWYDGSDPACPGQAYGPGDSFIEGANRIHNVKSAGGAEFVAIHMNPTGTSGPSFRVDEDKPTNCAP